MKLLATERQNLMDEKLAFEKNKEELRKKFQLPENIIELNVGGEIIDTLRATLIKVDGSMLQAMFSGLHPITKVTKLR